MTSPRNRTVCFLLLPKVHLLDLAGAAQVFYEASQIGPAPYQVLFCSPYPEVMTEQGLPMVGMKSPDEIQLNKDDIIFVPGIDFKSFKAGYFNSVVKLVAPWLREKYRAGVSIGSICSGSLILANAGLLNGRKCTTHWKCIDYMKEAFPQVNVQSEELFVSDRNIFTSAGMTSGIDLALSLVEQHHGPLLSAKVAREIVVYMRRNADDRQETIYLDYQTHFNSAIHRVQDYIISNPSRNASLEELASVASISVRNLTRQFRKATGHSVLEFKNAVRIELARKLVKNPDYTVEKIAEMCGFRSARHLRRVVGGGVRRAKTRKVTGMANGLKSRK